jgi:hypothetical protein
MTPVARVKGDYGSAIDYTTDPIQCLKKGFLIKHIPLPPIDLLH